MSSDTNGDYEKSATITKSTSIYDIHPHTGRRLRQFLRPNGRKVHIAQTPEELSNLKKSLSPPESFDIYLHGTDEHVSSMPLDRASVTHP